MLERYVLVTSRLEAVAWPTDCRHPRPGSKTARRLHGRINDPPVRLNKRRIEKLNDGTQLD